MPGNLRPILFLRRVLEVLFKPGWVEPKPVYAACSLLLLASVMLFTVVSSLQISPVEKPEQLTHSFETEQPEQPAPPISPSAKPTPSADKATVAEPVPSEPPAHVAAAGKAPAKWPVKGEVKLDFGWHLHPVFNDWRYHPGIDIHAPEGSLVQAMLSGQIEEIYTDKNTGLTVVVSSGQYMVSYGSLAAVNVSLKKGSYVNSGDQIGTVGSCTTEPYTHLHLTIKDGGSYIDPRKILK